MTFDFRVLLDILILALLVGTIFYASILNRNLKRLRSGRDELDGVVRNLSDSVARAETAIQGMKRSAAECGNDLQKRIDAARLLADELHIMNESGNNLAQRLEKSARVSRSSYDMEGAGPMAASRSVKSEKAAPSQVAAPAAEGNLARPKAASRAERELFAAIETARKGVA